MKVNSSERTRRCILLWALRNLRICARIFKELPSFARDLVDVLSAGAVQFAVADALLPELRTAATQPTP
ncbi:hypothetical protein D3C85_1485340 [compost metagenome]